MNDELIHELGDLEAQHADEINNIHEDYNEILAKLHNEVSNLKIENLKLKNRNALLEGYLRECYEKAINLKLSSEIALDSLAKTFPAFVWEDDTQ